MRQYQYNRLKEVFTTMANKLSNFLRFYRERSFLFIKKQALVLRLCLKRIEVGYFVLSLMLCIFLSTYNECKLVTALINICYSCIAGYIFFIISDRYPKALGEISNIKNIIKEEINILHCSKRVLDTSVRFTTRIGDEKDQDKLFIMNSLKSYSKKTDSDRIEFNDMFLSRLHNIRNQCKNDFFLIFQNSMYVPHEELTCILEIKDFINLSFGNKSALGISTFMFELEVELCCFRANIQRLERMIESKIDIYIYNKSDYSHLLSLLKTKQINQDIIDV